MFDDAPTTPTFAPHRLLPLGGLFGGGALFASLVGAPLAALTTAGWVAPFVGAVGVAAAAIGWKVLGMRQLAPLPRGVALAGLATLPWLSSLVGLELATRAVTRALSATEGGMASWIGAVALSESLRGEQFGALLAAGLGLGVSLSGRFAPRGTRPREQSPSMTPLVAGAVLLAYAIQGFASGVTAMQLVDIPTKAELARPFVQAQLFQLFGWLALGFPAIGLLGVVTSLATGAAERTRALAVTTLVSALPLIASFATHHVVTQEIVQASRRGFPAHLEVFEPMRLSATQAERLAIVLVPDAAIDARRRVAFDRAEVAAMLRANAWSVDDFGTLRRFAAVALDGRLDAARVAVLLDAAHDANLTDLEVQGVATTRAELADVRMARARPITGLLFPTLGAVRVRLQEGFTVSEVRAGYRCTVAPGSPARFEAERPTGDDADDVFQIRMGTGATAADLAEALTETARREGVPALVRTFVDLPAPSPETAPAQAAAPEAPTVATSPESVAPTTFRDAISRALRAKLPAVRACYERALASHPDLAGRVDATFTVGVGGRVTELRVDARALGEPSVGGCIERALADVSLPDPGPDAPVTVRYPFVFQAAAN